MGQINSDGLENAGSSLLDAVWMAFVETVFGVFTWTLDKLFRYSRKNPEVNRSSITTHGPPPPNP